MILPAGTQLYRYCLKTDLPEEWSSEFENPEYANRPNGKKNQIGAYFFYSNEETAYNVAGCALKNYGVPHGISEYTLTTCQTTNAIKLLDLTGDMKPFPFLEELHNNGIDVLTNDFINYFKQNQPFSICRNNFELLIKEINPFSQTNPHWHQNCALYKPILLFFTYNNNMHILGQLVTDFANGHAFKRMLKENGYDGYIFNEEKECPTICVFDAVNLTKPNHQIIKS